MTSILAWNLSDLVVSNAVNAFGNLSASNGANSAAVGQTLSFVSGASPVTFTVNANTGNPATQFRSSATGDNFGPQLTDPGGLQGTFKGVGNANAIRPIYGYTIRPVGSTNPADNIAIFVVAYGDNPSKPNTQNVAIISSAPLDRRLSYTFLRAWNKNSDAIGGNANTALPASLFSGTSGSQTGLPYTNIASAFFICFVRGTRIQTPDGLRAVEALAVGDLVLTADRGPQPIRWIGRSTVPGTGRLAPVLIRAGALGNTRDLRVSPQHRMLVTHWKAELYFGQTAVLAPAKALVNGTTIVNAPCEQVDYFHILFDRHEIIFAEGAPTESFHPGQYGIAALDGPIRDELMALFPDLMERMRGKLPCARPGLKSGEAKVLMAAIRDEPELQPA